MKILVTADAGLVSKAAGIGIKNFIEKPFTSKTIEESLLRIMEDEKQENGSSILPGLSAEGKDL